MDSNVQLDFATLALKGKRYQEAENIYRELAVKENSVEAWLGIGVCALYQIAEGKTIDEVIFCVQKAKSNSPELSSELDNQLMFHSTIVINTFSQIIQSAAEKHQKAKSAAKTGAIIAGVSFLAGMNSKSAFGTITSLAGTGAGVGVAVEALNKMDDYKTLISFVLSKCREIHNSVCNYVDNSTSEFETFVTEIGNNIDFIKTQLAIIEGGTKAIKDISILSDEDIKRLSYLENLPFLKQLKGEVMKERGDIMAKYDLSISERAKISAELKKNPRH